MLLTSSSKLLRSAVERLSTSAPSALCRLDDERRRELSPLDCALLTLTRGLSEYRAAIGILFRLAAEVDLALRLVDKHNGERLLAELCWRRCLDAPPVRALVAAERSTCRHRRRAASVSSSAHHTHHYALHLHRRVPRPGLGHSPF